MSVAALTKRRQLHGHDRKAMIQVLAKPSHADGRCKIFARRGEHPGVGRLAARAPEAPDRTILERLQQLDLQRVGHQPDLVEKDRPAMSDLQQAGLGLPGIGERAAFEPEELGFEQRVGNRRAVDVDERRIRARTHLVDDVGDKPLAGPCFTLDQHRRQASLRRGQPAEQPRQLFADSRKRRARPEQLIQHDPDDPSAVFTMVIVKRFFRGAPLLTVPPSARFSSHPSSSMPPSARSSRDRLRDAGSRPDRFGESNARILLRHVAAGL